MTTHIGNDGQVKLGANIVAEVTAFSFTERAAVADDSQLSDAWDTHLVGSKSWDGELTCWWDETDTNGQVAMTPGASVTMNLYPEGSTSGDTYYAGAATILEIIRSATRNGTTTVTFRFQGNGALTPSTV